MAELPPVEVKVQLNPEFVELMQRVSDAQEKLSESLIKMSLAWNALREHLDNDQPTLLDEDHNA